jgi:hypothetical protein
MRKIRFVMLLASLTGLLGTMLATPAQATVGSGDVAIEFSATAELPTFPCTAAGGCTVDHVAGSQVTGTLTGTGNYALGAGKGGCAAGTGACTGAVVLNGVTFYAYANYHETNCEVADATGHITVQDSTHVDGQAVRALDPPGSAMQIKHIYAFIEFQYVRAGATAVIALGEVVGSPIDSYIWLWIVPSNPLAVPFHYALDVPAGNGEAAFVPNAAQAVQNCTVAPGPQTASITGVADLVLGA